MHWVDLDYRLDILVIITSLMVFYWASMMMAILNFLLVKRESFYGPLSGFPNYCLESVGAPDGANATHMSRIQDKGRFKSSDICNADHTYVWTINMDSNDDDHGGGNDDHGDGDDDDDDDGDTIVM